MLENNNPPIQIPFFFTQVLSRTEDLNPRGLKPKHSPMPWESITPTPLPENSLIQALESNPLGLKPEHTRTLTRGLKPKLQKDCARPDREISAIDQTTHSAPCLWCVPYTSNQLLYLPYPA